MPEIVHPPENTDSAPDVEAKLAQMYALTQHIAALDEERIALREELVQTLNGPRYFIDPLTGAKYYGYINQPEPIDVDAHQLHDELVQTLGEERAEEVFQEVLKPLAIDKAAFKKAVEKQLIPSDVFVKVARVKPGKPHIRFGDPRQTSRGGE